MKKRLGLLVVLAAIIAGIIGFWPDKAATPTTDDAASSSSASSR